MNETAVHDLYEQRYADKLWSLVPAAIRAADSETLDGDGPLLELLERVGASMAVVRRSIDRLWEDQSVQTCDTWVVPYIADLLATNLVPSMDERGQRLDVANTIYYRRRKGTVALLEQLAHDVTGYEPRVIELFRCLGRNRHNLDPEIGRPSDSEDPSEGLALQRAERLTGLLTGTPAGGRADLRNRLGASLTGSAYDEYHHRADVRLGRGSLGWYGIPKVGFFLWRTKSIGVDRGTPVPVAGCPGYYAFDPTGRQIPLFTASTRGGNNYGESWVPVGVWQLPMPLTAPLWEAVTAEHLPDPRPEAYPDPDATLWPQSISVSPTGTGDPLTLSQVSVWPEAGLCATRAGAPDSVEVSYHYGLFGFVGAGPFERRQAGVTVMADPQPTERIPGGSATSLPTALAAIGQRGTVVVQDGLTLAAVAPVGSAVAPIDAITVRAPDQQRAVIRVPAGSDPWVFTGAATSTSSLRLEGVLLNGTDVVLRGRFHDVTISCCTLDPGTSGSILTPPAVHARSVDGRDLAPVTVWVEGEVSTLTIDRSITGPVRCRTGGLIETLRVSDSVVQGLPGELPGTLTELRDADGMFSALSHRRDELSTWLAGELSAAALAAVCAHSDHSKVSDADGALVVADLQNVIDGPLVWTASRFDDRPLRDSTAEAVLAPPTDTVALAALNRQLLAEAYPLAAADAAIATDAGVVELTRSTVLGAAYVHRLECSESVLDDVVRVRDAQEGCLRFSAWSTDSALPRRYESLQIAAGGPIMVSRRFGEWGYAQLHDGADSAILGGHTGSIPSLRTGSHDGSEMGVFSKDTAAIKDRSLLIKLQEYLPIGLSSILIHLPQPDPDGEYKRGRPWPPT